MFTGADLAFAPVLCALLARAAAHSAAAQQKQSETLGQAGEANGRRASRGLKTQVKTWSVCDFDLMSSAAFAAPREPERDYPPARYAPSLRISSLQPDLVPEWYAAVFSATDCNPSARTVRASCDPGGHG